MRFAPGRSQSRLALASFLLLASALLAVSQSAGASSQQWETRNSMRFARDEFGTAIVDDRIYVIGGMTGPEGIALDISEVYDPATDEWTRLPGLPVARRAVRAAAVGSTIYVMGGSNEANLIIDRVDAYDTVTQSWSARSPIPIPLQASGVLAIGPVIYVFGGLTDTTETMRRVFAYDTASDTWTEKAPMNVPRTNLGIALLDDQVYIVGGSSTDGPVASVERYDLATDSWSEVTPLPEPLMNHGTEAVAGRIHAVLHSLHYVYSPETGVWSSMAGPRIPRHGFGTAVIDDVLYVIGGCHEELYDTPYIEVLDLSGRAGPASRTLLIVSGGLALVGLSLFIIGMLFGLRPSRRADA